MAAARIVEPIVYGRGGFVVFGLKRFRLFVERQLEWQRQQGRRAAVGYGSGIAMQGHRLRDGFGFALRTIRLLFGSITVGAGFVVRPGVVGLCGRSIVIGTCLNIRLDVGCWQR